MIQPFFADCVRETSLTIGIDAVVLDGPIAGHRGFAGTVPVSTPFHYAISGVTHEDEWEVGEGMLDVDGKIVRSALSSSNNGALVPFSAGLKTVALTVASDWFANQTAGEGGGGITIDDVTGLSSALENKQDAGDYAAADHIHSGFLQIDGSGNLGVGTANPQKRLHIVDDVATQGSLRLGADATYHGSLRYNYGSGAMVIGTGAGQAEFHGDFQGHFYPGADNIGRCGISSNRWSVIFAASGAISTSDQRTKRDFDDIPEDWLDAWGEVRWQRFCFINGSRWHVGLVAQDVHAAFAAHGIDAFEIGLCCFDSWQAELDADGVAIRAAGDLWGLRYEECLAMEAIWHRREMARLESRIAALEPS